MPVTPRWFKHLGFKHRHCQVTCVASAARVGVMAAIAHLRAPLQAALQHKLALARRLLLTPASSLLGALQRGLGNDVLQLEQRAPAAATSE